MSNTTYVDSGFVDDGYLWTPRPVICQYGANRVELSGPSRRSGSLRLWQADLLSSGWARYSTAPIAAVHSLTLEYNRLRPDEVTALQAFQSAVDYSAQVFNFIDGATGYTVPAWFAEPGQSIEEKSLCCAGAKLGLQSLTPFIPYPGSIPTDIAAILATMAYSYTVAISRKQPAAWTSAGARKVSNKSALTRRIHTVTLVRRTAAELGNILSFFQNVAVGIKNKWSWTLDSVARQVRFAETAISWEQSSVNTARYDLTITLEEDL